MDHILNKTEDEPESEEYLYSFSVSSDELREIRIIDYFLSTNIKYSLSGRENTKKDKKFNIDVKDYSNVNLMCRSLSTNYRSEQKLIYSLGHNPNFRKFEYDKHKYLFNCEVLNHKPYGAEGNLFYIITIKYSNIDALELFLKNSLKYYDIHYCNCEDSDEKYTIYSNEEQYWEKIGSKNKRDLKYIYLPKKLKKDIVDDFENFLKPEVKEIYLKCGIPYKRIYLFEGVPGSGKTSLITVLASRNDYSVALLSLDPKTTDLKLNKAIKNLPKKCVLVIEDIDGLCVERKEGDNNKNCITLGGLLNTLDGIATPEGLIVFITTNYKSNLDSALIRPGRVDKSVRFDFIKIAQVKEMFKTFMGEKYDENDMNEFIEEYKTLNVGISASLLQQYLFRYYNKPKEAIENISDIKNIKISTKTRSNANEDAELYC